MTQDIVALVHNETLALYLAVHLTSKGTGFRLVLEEDAILSAATAAMVVELGATIERGAPEDIDLEGVRELYLHTFGRKFDKVAPLIARARAAGVELTCYADGLKGEYSPDFLRKAEIKRMLFFGWVFDRGDVAGLDVEAVPLSRFVSIFGRFRLAGLAPMPREPRSMIVMMRYWGRGDYALKPGVDLADAMYRSIPFNPDLPPQTIYVKSDPRVPKGAREAFLRICAERTAAEVRPFTDLIGAGADADQRPLEMLWFEPSGAACFAFDSSATVYLAALGEKRILFPNQKVATEIFAHSQGSNAVILYSRLFHRICQAIAEEGPDIPLIVSSNPASPMRRLVP